MFSCIDLIFGLWAHCFFLLSSDDSSHFIINEGEPHKMEGSDEVEMAFSGIQLSLAKKGETRMLLDGSSRGRAQPGRMLAIMGPSGAGKR